MPPHDVPAVYLVDDDAAILRALTRVLREEGFAVEAFASAEAFLSRRGAAPDGGCLVLDVTMPGLGGLDLQARLAEAGGSMPIVFLTGHGDIPTSVRAIKAGAADFLTKPVAADVLVRAVRKALDEHARTRAAQEEVAELARRFESLTEREREVLSRLVQGRLNKQVAADLGIVEQTVKFHRARIMERMQARTVAELMHMAARLAVGVRGDRGAPAVRPAGERPGAT